MDTSKSIANVIVTQKETLATAIAKYQYQQFSQDWSAAKPSHFQKSVRDIAYHLDYLTEAIKANQTGLFEDYIRWAKALFFGLNFPDAILPQTLESTRTILTEFLPVESRAVINQFIDAGLTQCRVAPNQPDSHIKTSSPLSSLAKAYLNALLTGKRHEASKLILDAVNEGASIKSIYLDVFQQIQREIGRLWQINQVTVAEEHYCTAATQLIMSQLYPHIFSTD